MQSFKNDSHEARVISVNMPSNRQAEILDQVQRLTARKLTEAQLVAELKRWLEDRYDRAWHVLIIKGSYWMHYSHEVDCSFQFHLGSHVYLMWRTPAG